MKEEKLTEYWLRGPVPGLVAELQPVAHALLQARDEIKELLLDFPSQLLWKRPADLASVAFHVQHIVGVQDRLLTYAIGNQLSPQQFQYLKDEGKENSYDAAALVAKLSGQTDYFLQALAGFTTEQLKEKRGVGRANLPSTVFGLLVHAAEHTMRHTGQLLVTVKMLKAGFGV